MLVSFRQTLAISFAINFIQGVYAYTGVLIIVSVHGCLVTEGIIDLIWKLFTCQCFVFMLIVYL